MWYNKVVIPNPSISNNVKVEMMSNTKMSRSIFLAAVEPNAEP